jgi:hypothetical protein
MSEIHPTKRDRMALDRKAHAQESAQHVLPDTSHRKIKIPAEKSTTLRGRLPESDPSGR